VRRLFILSERNMLQIGIGSCRSGWTVQIPQRCQPIEWFRELDAAARAFIPGHPKMS
jgi:hypothetical protein